ncbi:sigma-54-dependent transcriptional regulator [Candidatus Sordicultor fermentans]|jgi:DNA-binding NtrC family response regulator|uniref:sigma-54-dependent transcriptional regulator n=1 Tax=Candidatus Sordicultor fermentans TaxID=1953203 RepID=UPI0016B78462|nr:sigma-54 dependent transcriptional regulator [Atribacterota bacterium]NLY05260.1 sigma-54-dependent Fis family transcriptional regulator [Candidatus Atribacteria bacterium]MDY0135185.1 sigma-54 dependent transcriptional regulator [Atribacterota bacterium]HOQ50703.1 sigma-54 dependent transcriptional regulator [Candidatus Atribacteria bacterium]HPZ39993.1 sigma-54 dependent transcriptional regulator [Candidatus Atribacteria bacterium]
MRKILLVEKSALWREKIGNWLREEGYYLISVRDRDLAINCLEKEEIDIVLVEEKVLRENSFSLLSFIRQSFPDMVIIALGESNDSFPLQELFSKGVYDYISVSSAPSRILSVIKRAEEKVSLLEENKDLKKRVISRPSFAGIIGVSEKMQRVFSLILQVSQVQRPILLVGEQGTGKELAARAIHQYAFSEEKPFLKVLCVALPLEILPQEKPKEGTIYFEDVHLLPYKQQAEMLAFLEEYRFSKKSSDLRIIASSEVPLEGKVAEGSFRNDLYYFLNAVKIEIPPLRERKEDIPFLVDRFLQEIEEETGREGIRVDKEALRFLIEYDWPGNVVELRNTLEGMVILSSGDLLTSEDIPDYIKKRQREELLGVKVGMSMEEVEKILIQETLKFTRFNKTRAANILGISLRTLYRKIEQYDLALERN